MLCCILLWKHLISELWFWLEKVAFLKHYLESWLIFGVKIVAGEFSDCHVFGIASVQSSVTITFIVKQWENHKRHFKLTIVLHLFGKVWFYQALSPLLYPIPSALPTLELNPFIIKLNQAKPIRARHMPTGYNSWFWWWNITSAKVRPKTNKQIPPDWMPHGLTWDAGYSA